MFFKKKSSTSGSASKALTASTPTVASTDPGEPSYIGRDAAIDGQISCDGELHIDGAFRGTVRARVCVIDTHGVLQGELTGEVVHVRGRVIGPIQGSKIYIHSGAHVEGDVYHDTISIENGAYIYGTIRQNGAPTPVASAFPSLTDTGAPLTLPNVGDSTDKDGSGIRVVHSRS